MHRNPWQLKQITVFLDWEPARLLLNLITKMESLWSEGWCQMLRWTLTLPHTISRFKSVLRPIDSRWCWYPQISTVNVPLMFPQRKHQRKGPKAFCTLGKRRYSVSRTDIYRVWADLDHRCSLNPHKKGSFGPSPAHRGSVGLHTYTMTLSRVAEYIIEIHILRC